MGECDVPSFDAMRWNTVTTMTGENRILHFQKPTIRCPNGTTIRSDSVRVYEATKYYQLWGNVEFLDPESRLTSDRAQYFSEQRRLVAQENAVLTDLVNGSVVTGEHMVLIRGAAEGDEDSLTVQGGQPHATLYPTVQEVEEVQDPEEVPESEDVQEPAVIPHDSMMAAPDPADAAQDSAGVVLDTLAGGLPDTLAGAFPDSMVAPVSEISTREVVDTLPGALPGTIVALVSDTSAGEVPDSGALVPDMTAVDETVDEAPVERVPYEIDARRFVLQGSDYFRAVGGVEVTRDSLTAVADSLEYDKNSGALFLSRNASVVTADYDLSADDIRLDIPQDEIREARAVGDAVLEGQDIQLVSPILTLFFEDGLLERLVAVRDPVVDSIRAEMDDAEREQDRLQRGVPPLSVRNLGFTEFPERPFALAEDFALDGDSLEVLAPGEVIDEVRAIGAARGESLGQDSLNTEATPDLIRRDWLEGDTIIAFFAEDTDPLGGQSALEIDVAGDPDAPPPDLEREGQEPDSTGAEYRLRQLVASGRARSMYRMAPSDSVAAEEPGRFAVHYVIGEVITILLNEAGEAEHMEVVGQTRGIHLEPLSQGRIVVDSTAVPDTATIGPGAAGPAVDTTGTVPDTTIVDPDTSWVPTSDSWTRTLFAPPWDRGQGQLERLPKGSRGGGFGG
jgi:lipopolysaccharide export system protein LptA